MGDSPFAIPRAVFAKRLSEVSEANAVPIRSTTTGIQTTEKSTKALQGAVEPPLMAWIQTR